MKNPPSDGLIALVVIACSIILLAGLTFALTGNPLKRSNRTLRVVLPDVTGVQPTSQVKFAGAIAGSVTAVRMLTPAERIATGDPANAVEVTLSLLRTVPDLNEGLRATIGSDTILSDKFILLLVGDPSAPILADGALIPGTQPTTIDELSANLNAALTELRAFTGNAGGDVQGLMPRLVKLIDETSTMVAEARSLVNEGEGFVSEGRTLVKNGDTLVGDASGFVASGQDLIDDNAEALTAALKKLSTAADSLDELSTRAARTLQKNEANLNETLTDVRVAARDLKVTATYSRFLLESLFRRPQQLLWGTRRAPNELPPDVELPGARQPMPAQ